jgi:DNA-binding XRE family transcriptional regulator
MIDHARLFELIGKRVRQAREAQTSRMSQTELAKILGLQRTSITNIELGHQKPTLETIYRLCERFGLDIEEFLPAVADVTLAQEQSVVVGGKSHEVGIKTANVVARLRPDSRSRR